ncbi:nuclear transport factor 2 family protein [Sphingomonas montana]|uniref:nuclear transport factor 2 family protein n=1 Tax=Sphingomonas montana TaxID=1843236 RepID=UPI00096F7638|nr:nuclear transport factor 2 family protein [Sphingomonas montana]
MTIDAQTFIDALRTLEEGSDAGPIAALFADDAEISNPLVEHGGKDGAAAFWTAYRGTFDTIRSEFRNVVQGDKIALLEWVSEGQVDGKDVRYGGVSVLELSEDTIAAFRTYFDPSQIGRAVKADVG